MNADEAPRVIRFSDLVVRRWRNGQGVTRQIVPRTTTGEEPGWRLSAAEISQDGSFSAYPGYDRQLLVASEEPLELAIDDGVTSVRQGQSVAFPGEARVQARGVGPTRRQVLNLMVRRGAWEGGMQCRELDGTVVEAAAEGCQALVLLRGSLLVGEERLESPFDTVLCDETTPACHARRALVVRVAVRQLQPRA